MHVLNVLAGAAVLGLSLKIARLSKELKNTRAAQEEYESEVGTLLQQVAQERDSAVRQQMVMQFQEKLARRGSIEQASSVMPKPVDESEVREQRLQIADKIRKSSSS
jgi:hypothetical protein